MEENTQIQERLRFPNATVFSASFILMVLEIVAGRIMAPYLGVSLYTWTAIIGVILAGMSLGNWFGGRLADKSLTKLGLSNIFLLAGIATILVLFVTPVVGKELSLSRMPLMLSSLLFSLTTFLPASILLGAISPMVVKFDLRDLSKTGRTVGRVSAFGALGSIMGTFATGFFLIDWFGTSLIVRMAGVALILLAVLIRGQIKILTKESAFIGVLFLSSFLAPDKCDEETNYFCIRVSKSENYYVLRLDHLVHSYVSRHDVGDLGYAYEKVYAMLIDATKKLTPRNLYLGGGGYTMPRYLEKFFPGSENTVVEIDPGVTEVVYDRLGLPRDTSIKTINRDARIELIRMDPEEKYDFIFADAFNDYSVPYHLTTTEFHQLVSDHLVDDGWYALNIIDDYKHGRFLASTIRTLRDVFPEVVLIPLGEGWVDAGRSTVVVVAGKRPFPIDAYVNSEPPGLLEHANETDGKEKRQYVVPRDELDLFVETHDAIFLTDDHVPVDNLMAPVFIDAYKRT